MDYILTNNGAVLMTQVAAGRTLLFTRTESGSGYSASPAMLQSVIDKKQDMFLDEVAYENRQAVVKAVLSNMQLEEGYQLRQVGVYAKLEGDEADTLLIIGQQYNGEKIPPYQDGIIQIEYNIAMKVSGTGNVTIEGVGTGYVTKGQFLAHLNDNSNPHKVTAKQVGLEKVQNVDTNDQTPIFEEAEERGNIASGEKLSVIFGKIRKWFADLKGAAFCSVANNLVTTLPGSVLDARQGEKIKGQILQIYSDLGGFAPIIDETGKITGYTTTIGGADTVFPFSEIEKVKLIEALSNSALGLTINSTAEDIYNALFNLFPGGITTEIKASGTNANSPGVIYAWYSNKYNLTPYTKAKFIVTCYVREGAGYAYNRFIYTVGIGAENTAFSRSESHGLRGYSNESITTQVEVTLEVDVSSIIGEYYIGCSVQGYNSYSGAASKKLIGSSISYFAAVTLVTFE